MKYEIMELRQLRYFAEVARIGTFIGAADRLRVAQPSLWRQVRALEKELEIQLFERSGRGVALTRAGSQLLMKAEPLLAQADAITILSSELARGRVGVVTLSCAHPHVPRFLAPLIGEFRRSQPDIHIALHESPHLPNLGELLRGEVDFLTSTPRADDRLVGCQLGDVRLVAVMADDHPWHGRSRIAVSELADVAVLTGESDGLAWHLLRPALHDAGIALDVVHQASNAASLIALAQAGIGVAILPDDNLTQTTNPHWPCLTANGHPMSVPIWLYWTARTIAAPAGRSFADHVRRVRGST